ncbi:hypothetical protein [Prevotella nigrescens]
MKIKLNLFILFILLSNSMFSQSIKITNHYGSENKEIQDLIDFESIYIEQLSFEGESLTLPSHLSHPCLVAKVVVFFCLHLLLPIAFIFGSRILFAARTFLSCLATPATVPKYCLMLQR